MLLIELAVLILIIVAVVWLVARPGGTKPWESAG